MTKWSAATLKADYPRCIFGYDLRAKLKSAENDFVFPATIDFQVWKTSYEDVPNEYQHGLNLFRDEETLLLFEEENSDVQDSEKVAFDIPLDRAITLAANFGFDLIDVCILKNNPKWHFVGFDVIDPIASTSGLHTLWNPEYKEIIIRMDYPAHQNKYGLFKYESEAIEAAIFFDVVFKTASGQSPFTPCGVWVKADM